MQPHEIVSTEAGISHAGLRIEIGVEQKRHASGCRLERTRCKSDGQTKCLVGDLDAGVNEVRRTRDAHIGDDRRVADRVGRFTVKSDNGPSPQRRKRTPGDCEDGNDERVDSSHPH